MEDTAAIVAAAATTIAAIMVALNAGARLTGLGFIVFSVGSIAWIVVGALSGQPTLLWQNVALLLINVFGAWRWLGLRARYAKGAKAISPAASE